MTSAATPRRKRLRILPRARGSDGSVIRDPVVWLLAAVALVVQLLYLWGLNLPYLAGDQFDYKAAGDHFAVWWGFPNSTLQRMPGYPALLSLAYSAGLGDDAVKVLQAALLSLGVLAVAHMAKLVGGRAAARVGGALFACYVPVLSFSSLLLTEATAVVLTLVAVVAAMQAARASEETWARWVVLTALALAAGTIIRADQLVLAVVLTATLVLTAPTRRRGVVAAGVVALAFCVVFAPWIGRNYALVHEPQPFGTSGRLPTAIGVHLPFDREVGGFSTYRRSVRFWTGARADGFSPEEASVLDVKRELRENVLHHPREFAVTRLIGQAQLWVWPVTAKVQFNTPDPAPYGLLMALHLLIVVAGVAGFVRFRRHLVIRVAIATTVLVAARHLVTFPQPRYVIPVLPLLMVAAAPLLVEVTSGVRERVRSRRARASTRSA